MFETRELWTPQGVIPLAPTLGGTNTETGGQNIIHTFRFRDAKSGRELRLKIGDDGSMSRAEVEEHAAGAYEKWLVELRTENRKRPPTPEERKEIGHALEEFRKYKRRRDESAKNKIYF